jgi:hypothetical protein
MRLSKILIALAAYLCLSCGTARACIYVEETPIVDTSMSIDLSTMVDYSRNAAIVETVRYESDESADGVVSLGHAFALMRVVDSLAGSAKDGDTFRLDLIDYGDDGCASSMNLGIPFVVISDRAFSGTLARGEFTAMNADAWQSDDSVLPGTFSQNMMFSASRQISEWFERALSRAGFTTMMRDYSDVQVNKTHLAELDRMAAWIALRHDRIERKLAALDASSPYAARTQMLLRMGLRILEYKSLQVTESSADLHEWLE